MALSGMIYQSSIHLHIDARGAFTWPLNIYKHTVLLSACGMVNSAQELVIHIFVFDALFKFCLAQFNQPIFGKFKGVFHFGFFMLAVQVFSAVGWCCEISRKEHHAETEK